MLEVHVSLVVVVVAVACGRACQVQVPAHQVLCHHVEMA